MRRYFAYGSNMDAEQMSQPDRAPNAEKVETAKLAGYEFFINERGVANIRKKGERSVFGIVFNISDEDEKTLNVCEGVQHGTNIQEHLSSLDAFCYVAANTTESYTPRDGYLEKIVKAARDNDFPPEYIAELEGWFSKQTSPSS